jgi:uncharacterized lipoprotein YddW (UPF0748 family)
MSSTSLRRVLGSLLLCAPLALTGCATTGPHAANDQDREHLLPDHVRAIWVTRYDYKTEQDVRQIVRNCADAGFNAILFQVRGNGTAFYNSELEPWAEQFHFKNPGYDPLAVACDEAHAHNIQLHAWVNVMPAWKGESPPPEGVGQLYHTHPEWFWYDQHGHRQQLTWFYVSVNPCWPEVRQYLVDVFQEIVANYDVDGLHLDYIRFPAEPPATPRGSDIDYPHDARTLELFRTATGKSPQQDPAAWDNFRTECVTKLVRQIHQMCRETKPSIALTAAVGANRARSLAHHRDDRRWAREKLLDAVLLMNYTSDTDQFAQRNAGWIAEQPPVPIVPGLSFGRQRDRSPEEVARTVAAQIEQARKQTGHFCVFAYASMFDAAGAADNSAEQVRKSRQTQQLYRSIIVPAIRSSDRTKP